MNTSPPSRHLTALEFEKVLELIGARSHTSGGRKWILDLRPDFDGNVRDGIRRDAQEWIDFLALDDGVDLKGYSPLETLSEKLRIPGAVLDPRELFKLASNLETLRLLHRFLGERRDRLEQAQAKRDQIDLLTGLRKDIMRAIMPSGEVADEASVDLGRIRRRIDSARSETRGLLERMARERKDEGELQPTLRNDRFVLPVPRSHHREVPGIVHDRSASGATVYVEPIQAVEMNNELHRLLLDERAEIARILTELSGRARAAADGFERNEKILFHLDGLQSLGRFSRDFGARYPAESPSGRLVIEDGRHPLLLSQYRTENREDEVVPLDLALDPGVRVLLITGPNTGGKTVVLKTVGILVALDLSGIPVPCSEKSELPRFTGVFADIGDEQSIEHHMSTFSSHVTNLMRMLEQVKPGGLVLLDELGAATDPEEGGALGRAILERLAEIGATTLASTHYGSLKVFAHDRPGIENASMEFDPDRRSPLFRLRVGVPGSSRGLATARALGLPEEIIRKAESYLGREKAELEALMIHLEGESRKLASETESLRIERERLEAESLRVADRQKEIDELKRSFLNEARREFGEFIGESRRRLEEEIESIKTRGADRESNLEARATLGKIEAEMRARENELGAGEDRDPGTKSLRVGDWVRVRALGSRGRVVEIREGGEKVLVESGALKIEVSAAEVEISGVDKNVEWKGVQAPPGSGRHEAGYSDDVDPVESDQVMIRGLQREEALEAVDRFLDRCVVAGLTSARIVHGIGEGVLRAAVHEMLRDDRRVASFEVAPLGEGGQGVTVARLR